MPKNEDGEFELILGNGQLMSVFFVVVILLGVFFAVGYIVGRNASSAAGPEVASHRTEPERSAVDTPASKASDSKPADSPKPTDTPKATATRPQETASQQGPATKPAPPPEPAPAPVKASARAATSGEPQSGRTYLQLSAVDHDKADIMVEMLRKKNFPAIAAEIPEKPGVFRVLMGPISDADVSKTRSDLQNAGFAGKEAVKRTF